MNIKTKSSCISRRQAITGTLAAAAIPATAVAETDPDPHLRWLEAWRKAFDTDDDVEADRLRLLIAVTPPNTQAGAASQLRLLWEDSEGLSDYGDVRDKRLLVAALAFLESHPS